MDRTGTADRVAGGRAAFDRRAWAEAYAALSAADRDRPLDPADLERLATAAYLVGRDDDSDEVWARAHQAYLKAGESARAARCAFWLGFRLVLRGEQARGGGWLARAQRVIDDAGLDCVEQGYLLVDAARRAVGTDAATANALFNRVAETAERFGDRDLAAFGFLGRGESLIRLGDAARGLALFDEAMVAVTTGEVSPMVAGIVYCAVLGECQGTCDVGRAREWTVALSRWCESQPDLVPYRGQCLIHRAEIMQLHGDWPGALAETRNACERLDDHPAGALAYYRLAELHRLRGAYDDADAAYREASRRGGDPQPGLALLRLAQGDVDAAVAALRRSADETQDRTARLRILGAYVEALLTAGDVTAARAAADELSRIAGAVDVPFLHAAAAQAAGAVLLAEGDPAAACPALRRAWALWRELEAPYDAARVRVLIALATRALGDEDTAEMELDAARWVFQELGAVPDLARVDALARVAVAPGVAGLTGREVEVLRLVAAGRTNREIGTALVISEHTVRRHLQNVFGKLGVPSRAAATAYAVQHDLV